jgi:hypothetical protein
MEMKRFEISRGSPHRRWRRFRLLLGPALLLLAGGCAAPGPPLPPTLNLPQPVNASSLSAVRVGDQVVLRWTTPSQTTDKLPIKGPITAEICRSATAPAGKLPCTVIATTKVAAGPSQATVTLPPDLTTGAPRLVAYRVKLLNSADRSAGASPVVFAAAGPGLTPVAGFAGSVAKEGVVLRWDREPVAARESSVELERTILDPGPADPERRNAGLPGTAHETTESRFRAGSGLADPGGTIDRTVELGHAYRYTAERVDRLKIGGQTVELRSLPSAALTFAVRDLFPPEVPQGLVAAPGFAGDPPRPAIDLAWQPDVEARVAGYRVYRRDAEAAGGWQRIGPDRVSEPAYRDAAVVAGRRYAYRVTAVSTAGNESAPCIEVLETAPAP